MRTLTEILMAAAIVYLLLMPVPEGDCEEPEAVLLVRAGR